MIGRVTQQTIQRSTLANLQTNLAAMSNLQNRASGSSMITKPSDDPAGTAKAIALRASLNANDQASRNIDDGNGWLTTADTALQSSVNLIRQARDLTVQGSNTGALNKEGREALAVQIEGIRNDLLSQANTKYQGRLIFAGTSNAAGAVAVSAGPPASYTSNAVLGATVDRRVDTNTTIRVDVDGAKVFGPVVATDTQPIASDSAFATLDRIAAALRADPQVASDVSKELSTLDAHRDKMLNELSGVGARQTQILSAQTRALDTKTTLTVQLGAIEDVDLAKTLMDLQTQEVTYKAALGAAARVMQPTLLDFLR